MALVLDNKKYQNKNKKNFHEINIKSKLLTNLIWMIFLFYDNFNYLNLGTVVEFYGH